MIDCAIRTSGSSVSPAGSNRRLVNLETNVSSGTPYCRPIDTAIENASITPASVEPCLPSLRKISPSSPSGCAPEVMYPSAPPTVNDVVREARDFGRRLRKGLEITVGSTGTAISTDDAGLTALSEDFAFASANGWPTLQLSR